MKKYIYRVRYKRGHRHAVIWVSFIDKNEPSDECIKALAVKKLRIDYKYDVRDTEDIMILHRNEPEEIEVRPNEKRVAYEPDEPKSLSDWQRRGVLLLAWIIVLGVLALIGDNLK